MSYADSWKDPRWQRKRLEIMQAAQFECENCGDASSTLAVHHTIYRKGHFPWQYDNFELVCLCEKCHAKYHADADLLQEVIAFLSPTSVNGEVLGFALGQAMRDDVRFCISNRDVYPEIATGIGIVWLLDWDCVCNLSAIHDCLNGQILHDFVFQCPICGGNKIQRRSLIERQYDFYRCEVCGSLKSGYYHERSTEMYEAWHCVQDASSGSATQVAVIGE